MHTTWSARFLVVLLLAWPASAPAQGRPDAADTVRLRFNWPVGTVASVATTRFRERATEKTDTVAGSARYRMRVEQHPEGLLIVYDSFDVASSAGMAAGAAALQAVAERLADLVPSYIVTRNGAFTRVHDVAGMTERMNSAFGSVLGQDSTGRARMALESLISEPVLNQIAAQEWNALVGMWIDADLVVGQTYHLEEEAPIPLIPGARVQMLSEFSIRRRVPCSEGGTTLDCVEIQLHSSPDAEAVRAIIRQFMDRVAANPALVNFAFESLDLKNELVLIIEPTALLPHRARLTKRVQGVVRAAGKRGDVAQLDVRTFSFTYR